MSGFQATSCGCCKNAVSHAVQHQRFKLGDAVRPYPDRRPALILTVRKVEQVRDGWYYTLYEKGKEMHVAGAQMISATDEGEWQSA